jgi:hypothetical protein
MTYVITLKINLDRTSMETLSDAIRDFEIKLRAQKNKLYRL